MLHDHEALMAKLFQTDLQWQQFVSDEIKRLLDEHEDWVAAGKPPIEIWFDMRRYLKAMEGGDSLHAMQLDDKLASAGYDVRQLLKRVSPPRKRDARTGRR